MINPFLEEPGNGTTIQLLYKHARTAYAVVYFKEHNDRWWATDDAKPFTWYEITEIIEEADAGYVATWIDFPSSAYQAENE
jgi:hypothetical protein